MAIKQIIFETFMLSTDRPIQFKRETVYTNDKNTVEIIFDIKDIDDLTPYTPNVLLYMRDGSFYQITEQTLITKSGTRISYTLKDNEGKHSGLAKAQLLLIDGNEELPSAKYEFRIEPGLDSVVATEVMIQDWSTITAEAQAYIDDFVSAEADRQTTFETNVSNRQQTFQTNESTRQSNETERISNEEARQALYNELLETGVLQTNINTKLEELETQYAPHLTEVTAQLAHKASKADVANIASGTPLFADSVDGMTNNERIYVNTSNGNIYSYNNNTEMFEDSGQKYTETGLSKGQVKPTNTNFFDISTNLFDKEAVTSGKRIDPATGELQDNASTFVSQPYYLSSNEGFTLVGGYGRYVEYDSANNVIKTETLNSSNERPFMTDANHSYIRIADTLSSIDIVQLNEGNIALPYEPYYNNIKKEYLNKSIIASIAEGGYKFAPVPITGEISVTDTVEALDGTGPSGLTHLDIDVSTVYGWYDQLMADYPDYISKEQIGTDESGLFPIYAYTFNPEAIDQRFGEANHKPLPKIILGSGMHSHQGLNGTSGDANNQIFVLYWFMKDICEKETEQDLFSYLRHNIEFRIIPCQNPWGVENTTRHNSNLVDINRNFDVKDGSWSFGGDEGSNNWRGPEPFSESETRALRDYVLANQDAILVIDFHMTGTSALDNQWIYFEFPPDNDLIHPASYHIRRMSSKWREKGYFNSDYAHFGYVYHGRAGKFQQWVNQNLGIPGAVIESAPNIDSNLGVMNRKEIMDMNYENATNWLVHVLQYLKDK